MPTPGLGHKSYVQFVKEATWGSFVAPTAAVRGQRLELVSWNVAPSIGVIDDPSLNGKVSRRAKYQGGLSYRGTFRVRANYEGLEFLLDALMGGTTRTVVSGNVVDWSFAEASSLPSLSMEVVLGDIPSGKSFNLVGVKIPSASFRVSAGTGSDAMMMVEFTVVAKDMTSNNTVTPQTTVNLTGCSTSGTTLTCASTTGLVPGMVLTSSATNNGLTDGVVIVSVTNATTAVISVAGTNNAGPFAITAKGPEVPGLYPVLFNHALSANIIDGTSDVAADVRLRSLELTIESPMTDDRFYLSSLNMDEPLRQDFLNATWRLTQEFTTRSQFDAARSFTAGTLQVLFQHPSSIAGGGQKRELALKSGTCYLTDYSAPVEGYGVMVGSSTWSAIYTEADLSSVLLRVRNARPALS